jgi:hypothetical protein
MAQLFIPCSSPVKTTVKTKPYFCRPLGLEIFNDC